MGRPALVVVIEADPTETTLVTTAVVAPCTALSPNRIGSDAVGAAVVPAARTDVVVQVTVAFAPGPAVITHAGSITLARNVLGTVSFTTGATVVAVPALRTVSVAVDAVSDAAFSAGVTVKPEVTTSGAGVLSTVSEVPDEPSALTTVSDRIAWFDNTPSIDFDATAPIVNPNGAVSEICAIRSNEVPAPDTTPA
jgi:hypothetical protein